MMRRLRSRALVLCSALLTGCAFDLNVTAGAAVPKGDAPANVAWSGEVHGSVLAPGTLETGIWPIDHLTAGFELQGHALRDHGNYFSAGGSLGLVKGDSLQTLMGVFDVGGPLGWGANVRGYYVGSTLSYLWSLDRRSPITARNSNLRAIYLRPQIGPMLRYRRQSIDPAGMESSRVTHELLLGLSLRMLLTTDLL
jgi:hypothetical protein